MKINWIKRLFRIKERPIEFPGIACSDRIYRDKDGVLRNKVDRTEFLNNPDAVKIVSMFDNIHFNNTSNRPDGE